MKKKALSLALCLCMVAAILAGCGCKHEFKNATCEEPITCALCVETEGKALGHTWKPATCEDPKTCAECGKTEGEALGHTWEDATCEAPKTCSVCATTEGEALEHAFGEWMEADEETEERTCDQCGLVEAQSIDREAVMLRLLEGEWLMEEALAGETIIGLDELPGGFEGTAFLFESDGSGQLKLMGKEIAGQAKFYSYEKDSTDNYIFEFHADGEYVDCFLCHDKEGESFLLLGLNESTALVFYKSV